MKTRIRRRLVNTTKICAYCKKEFHPYNSIQKFCSYKCLYDFRYEIKKDTDCTKTKKCAQCGEEYKPANYRNKFCSRTCFLESVKKRRKISCPTCGKEFIQTRVSQQYCSRKCGEPYKKKTAKFKKGYIDLLWGELVKIRAGLKCEYCGKTNSLNSHHIFSRSNMSLRWDVNNGICLCASHHVLGLFSAHKSPLEFAEWLREKRGEEWYQILKEKSKIITKLSVADKLKVAENLKEKIKLLEG